eukprot:g52911.t1
MTPPHGQFQHFQTDRQAIASGCGAWRCRRSTCPSTWPAATCAATPCDTAPTRKSSILVQSAHTVSRKLPWKPSIPWTRWKNPAWCTSSMRQRVSTSAWRTVLLIILVVARFEHLARNKWEVEEIKWKYTNRKLRLLLRACYAVSQPSDQRVFILAACPPVIAEGKACIVTFPGSAVLYIMLTD